MRILGMVFGVMIGVHSGRGGGVGGGGEVGGGGRGGIGVLGVE